MFFALFLYNESIMFLFTLTFNVKFTLNIKSVVLKMCYGMTPVFVTSEQTGIYV